MPIGKVNALVPGHCMRLRIAMTIKRRTRQAMTAGRPGKGFTKVPAIIGS
jgi:hypothetical protein